jgi:hypothetical protein
VTIEANDVFEGESFFSSPKKSHLMCSRPSGWREKQTMCSLTLLAVSLELSREGEKRAGHSITMRILVIVNVGILARRGSFGCAQAQRRP